jgi:hypothetical protein
MHAMNRSEGAAVRVQLDGMIRALDGFAVQAGEHGDNAVLELLARLHDARDVARRIETRGLSLGKGARLIELPNR